MLQSGVKLYPAFSFTIEGRELPVILFIAAVGVAGKTILSRREQWEPGLILPVLWLLWTAAGIGQQIVLLWRDRYPWTFCLGTGLTALAIYAVCRLLRRRSRKKQLKKTRIDDL